MRTLNRSLTQLNGRFFTGMAILAGVFSGSQATAQTATSAVDVDSPSAWTDSKLGKPSVSLLSGLNYQMGGEKYSVPFFGLKLDVPTELPLENWKMFSSTDFFYSALPTRQERLETSAGMKDVFATSVSTTIFNTTSRLGVSLGYAIDQSQNALLFGTMPEVGVGHRYENGHIEARVLNARFEDRHEMESPDTNGVTGRLTGVCIVDEHRVSDLMRLRTFLKAGWLSHMGEKTRLQESVDVDPNDGFSGTYVKACIAPTISLSQKSAVGVSAIYEGYSYKTQLIKSTSTSNLSLRLFGEVGF